MTRAVVKSGHAAFGTQSAGADNQWHGLPASPQPFEASPSVMTRPAPETGMTASPLGDVIVEGAASHASHLNDLLSGVASGKDPALALIELQKRIAHDEAMQEALSNTLAAYHRMAMAVIGNMKA